MKDFISKTISQEVEKERERIEKCIPKEVKGRIRAWRCGSDADYVSGYNLALKEIRKDFPKE